MELRPRTASQRTSLRERVCVCLDADTETEILSGQEGSRSLLCCLHICSCLSGGVHCVEQQSQLLCLTPRIQPLSPGVVLHGMVQSRLLWTTVSSDVGFPGGSDSKASVCSAGDPGSILGLGISPGEGTDNPLQYSCLENPMDGGSWWDTLHGVAKSWTQLSDFTFFFSFKLCHALGLRTCVGTRQLVAEWSSSRFYFACDES